MASPARPRPGYTITELLVVLGILGMLMALLLPAVQRVREAARRTQCVANLQQIGIAIQLYEQSHRMIPAGNTNGLSTHVLLLPYLEQRALFEGFDLSKGAGYLPNSQFFDQVIQGYVCPSDGGLSSATNYAGNGGTGFADGPNGVFLGGMDKIPLTFGHIVDGLSHTAAFSEIATAESGSEAGAVRSVRPIHPKNVELLKQHCLSTTGPGVDSLGRPWTNGSLGRTRYNHMLTPNTRSCRNGTHIQSGIFTAGSSHSSGANTLFLDGHVTFTVDGISPDVWRAIGSRAGWESVVRVGVP